MTSVEGPPLAASDAARRAMIDSQLRTSGVNDETVLERMYALAREPFVPEGARRHAYIDRAIALGDGAFLASPVVHGKMLQEARPTLADRALVVDGGSGYLPELLRPMVGSLEVVAAAGGDAGGSAGARFTLLLVDGAAEVLPPALVDRLADGARVVTGWLRDGITCLAIGRKSGGAVALLPVAEMGIPVLPAFARPPEWSF